MEVKRGRGPETVERPIQIEFSRHELLEVVTAFVRKKVNATLDLQDLKGIGSDNVLEQMVFTGVEIVPLNWSRPAQPQVPPPANPA